MSHCGPWQNIDLNLIILGAGRSKKAAKRVAAQAMLDHIKSLVEENGEGTVLEEEEEEDIPLVGGIISFSP